MAWGGAQGQPQVIPKPPIRGGPVKPAPQSIPLTPVPPAGAAARSGSAPDVFGSGGGMYGGQSPAAYIASLFAPQQAQLQSQQALRSAGYQQLVKEFAASLGQLSQGLAPYAAASSQQNANANAAAASLNAANPNASAQANLAAINAPQAQRDAAAAQNSTVFGGGAALLQYAGGALPQDQFQADAAGRAAYLAAQPAIGQQLAAQGLGQINSAAQADTFRLGQAKATALQQAQSDLAKWQQTQQGLANNMAMWKAAQGIKVAGMTGYYIGADGKIHPTAATVKAQAADAVARSRANTYATSAKARAQVQQQNADTAQTRAARLQAAPNGPKVNVALSKVFRVLLDSYGHIIPGKTGQPIFLPGPPTKPKYTAALQSKWIGTASTIVANALNPAGYTDAKGVAHAHNPAWNDWNVILNEMDQSGIPHDIAIPIMWTRFKPGSNNAPVYGPGELAALKKSAARYNKPRG